MIRRFVCKKSIEGDRFVKRGETLPNFITMTCARGLLQPVADHRKVENDMKLFAEFYDVQLLPGRVAV